MSANVHWIPPTARPESESITRLPRLIVPAVIDSDDDDKVGFTLDVAMRLAEETPAAVAEVHLLRPEQSTSGTIADTA
jgi:hypothetical protein